MKTADIAAQFGVTPKRLRDFWRASPDYANCGSGGTYDWQPSDLPAMREKFDAWAASRAVVREARTPRDITPANDRTVIRRAMADHDRPLPVSILRVAGTTRTDRVRAAELSRQRVDRLEARLRELGLHVSQLRDRHADAS